MELSIDSICREYLGSVERQDDLKILPGWYSAVPEHESFVAPDLNCREGFSDLASPIWLVSAPGAVGKSTLAKKISNNAGAVYLDLSQAATVAGNYLTGGLVKSGLFKAWTDNSTCILIDALDEARLRVTQSSFHDFIEDIFNASENRNVPTLLFGRVGIIEDVWLILHDFGLSAPIVDIQHFNKEQSVRFVMSSLSRLSRLPKHSTLQGLLQSNEPAFRDVARDFAEGLESSSGPDGAKFAGYAPVLEAVATMLAGITNPAQLDASKQTSMQKEVVNHIPTKILERESDKLRTQLTEFPDEVKSNLYSSDEQLDRLVRIVYDIPTPLTEQPVPPDLAASYDDAVQAFIVQHPFLDGTGHQPANTVLSAMIDAYALVSDDPAIREVVAAAISGTQRKPNPFFADFYLNRVDCAAGANYVVPPEHIVHLYESVNSRAEAGTSLYLSIEGDDEEELADVEIQVVSSEGRPALYMPQLKTSQAGTLWFSRNMRGVFVDAPLLDVRIGSGNAIEIGAPTLLNVSSVAFRCEELSVVGGDGNLSGGWSAVQIEAKSLDESELRRAPTVRAGVEFTVSWPGSNQYPWTAFSNKVGTSDLGEIDECARRLSKIVLAFRSHSKGQLARLKDKLDHARMSKGCGAKLIEKMREDKVITQEGRMYILDPDALRDVLGTSFSEARAKSFGEKTLNYLRRVEEQW